MLALLESNPRVETVLSHLILFMLGDLGSCTALSIMLSYEIRIAGLAR